MMGLTVMTLRFIMMPNLYVLPFTMCQTLWRMSRTLEMGLWYQSEPCALRVETVFIALRITLSSETLIHPVFYPWSTCILSIPVKFIKSLCCLGTSGICCLSYEIMPYLAVIWMPVWDATGVLTLRRNPGWGIAGQWSLMRIIVNCAIKSKWSALQ